MWAVSKKEIFENWSYNHSWGVAFDGTHSQWFPWDSSLRNNRRHNDVNLKHLRCDKCEVDLLLDCDKRELRICKVGDNEKEKEAIISNIRYSKEEEEQPIGFVPHMNLGTSATLPIQIQIAKIPAEYYGVYYDNIWTIE